MAISHIIVFSREYDNAYVPRNTATIKYFHEAQNHGTSGGAGGSSRGGAGGASSGTPLHHRGSGDKASNQILIKSHLNHVPKDLREPPLLHMSQTHVAELVRNRRPTYLRGVACIASANFCVLGLRTWPEYARLLRYDRPRRSAPGAGIVVLCHNVGAAQRGGRCRWARPRGGDCDGVLATHADPVPTLLYIQPFGELFSNGP